MLSFVLGHCVWGKRNQFFHLGTLQKIRNCFVPSKSYHYFNFHVETRKLFLAKKEK